MIAEGRYERLMPSGFRIWPVCQVEDDGQTDRAPQVQDEEGLDVADQPLEPLPAPLLLRLAVPLSSRLEKRVVVDRVGNIVEVWREV